MSAPHIIFSLIYGAVFGSVWLCMLSKKINPGTLSFPGIFVSTAENY